MTFSGQPSFHCKKPNTQNKVETIEKFILQTRITEVDNHANETNLYPLKQLFLYHLHGW